MGSFKEVTAGAMSLAKRSLVYGVGINDAPYATMYSDTSGRHICPYYTKWKDMLKRCYCPKYLTKYQTYIGCTVCSEWLLFSNFRTWMLEQDWEGYELDKDILIKDNKCYSPETCLFVSKQVNNILRKATGTYKVGVRLHSCGKFQARCYNLEGKETNLGLFLIEDDAHIAYLKFKKVLLTALADKQHNTKLKQVLLNIANSYTL